MKGLSDNQELKNEKKQVVKNLQTSEKTLKANHRNFINKPKM